MSKELPSLLKIKSKPVLSVAILDQINIYQTSQKVLTACTLPSQSMTAKMKHLSRQTLQPGAGLDEDCIMSEFHPYCPESWCPLESVYRLLVVIPNTSQIRGVFGHQCNPVPILPHLYVRNIVLAQKLAKL